jgi:hypothetical protein
MGDARYTLAELCITAAAEAWRDAGEVLASGLGSSTTRGGLARLTFAPDLLMTDGEAFLVAGARSRRPARRLQPRVEGMAPVPEDLRSSSGAADGTR